MHYETIYRPILQAETARAPRGRPTTPSSNTHPWPGHAPCWSGSRECPCRVHHGPPNHRCNSTSEDGRPAPWDVARCTGSNLCSRATVNVRRPRPPAHREPPRRWRAAATIARASVRLLDGGSGCRQRTQEQREALPPSASTQRLCSTATTSRRTSSSSEAGASQSMLVYRKPPLRSRGNDLGEPGANPLRLSAPSAPATAAAKATADENSETPAYPSSTVAADLPDAWRSGPRCP